jgi:hypothetical protein
VVIDEAPKRTETIRGQLPRENDDRDSADTSTSPQETAANIRQGPPIDDYANLRGRSLLKGTLAAVYLVALNWWPYSSELAL